MPCLRILLGALMVLAVASFGAQASQPFVEGGRLTFELADPDGNLVSSSDASLRDKVVLVEILGTWCPPCISEIPTLVDLEERYADQGLVIVGIAFERDKTAKARRGRLGRFITKRGINYLILDGGTLDSLPETLPMLRNVRSFPIEIILDRSGKVVHTSNGHGYSKEWADWLDEELRGLLIPGAAE